MEDWTAQPAGTAVPPEHADLDLYVAPGVRRAIEGRYLEPITALGSFAEILKDATFLETPAGHPALYADHGVTHARDVARQILQVLDTAHGHLIPRRSAERLRWMKSYGVLVALLHDIGMVETSPEGRAMHPERAATEIMSRDFDAILAELLEADGGGVAERVAVLAASGALGPQPAGTILREMLAMALCHSKRKVPVACLDDPARLAGLMRAAIAPGAGQRVGTATTDLARAPGFAWLAADSAPGREIVADVTDTLRALRSADALRQRGTVLKTSGQYEVFIDQRTANAVYAFRPDGDHLYLLEVDDPVAIGEANLSSCQLEAGGDLRVSFHHGLFGSEEAAARAAACAARVLAGIYWDAIGSFERAAPDPALTAAGDLRLLVEETDVNPAFSARVRDALAAVDPAVAAKVRLVPSIAAATPEERARYLAARDVDWDLPRRRDILDRVARSGHRTERIDPEAAFRDVREIGLRAGERLIRSDTPAGFVYIPLGEGLRGRPLGGYGEFVIGPWIPVGITGVIRGATRNADIRADRDLGLLAIPRAVFLSHWHFTYGPGEFAAAIRSAREAPG